MSSPPPPDGIEHELRGVFAQDNYQDGAGPSRDTANINQRDPVIYGEPETAPSAGGPDPNLEFHQFPRVPSLSESQPVRLPSGLEMQMFEALDKLNRSQELLCWKNEDNSCHTPLQQSEINQGCLED